MLIYQCASSLGCLARTGQPCPLTHTPRETTSNHELVQSAKILHRAQLLAMLCHGIIETEWIGQGLVFALKGLHAGSPRCLDCCHGNLCFRDGGRVYEYPFRQLCKMREPSQPEALSRFSSQEANAWHRKTSCFVHLPGLRMGSGRDSSL